jgi:hypothetical protein
MTSEPPASAVGLVLHPTKPGGAGGTLAAVSCWQYAQLTITVDGHASSEDVRTIVWHGRG